MKLVVEIFTGPLLQLNVEEDATVGDLKKEIVKQENLPMDRLILILGAAQHFLMANDEVPLRQYGAGDGSRIYIFFKPLVNNGAANGTQTAQPPSVPNTPSPAGNATQKVPEETQTSVDSPCKADK